MSKSVSRNLVMNYLVTGINLIFPLVVLPIVTRALSTEGYGAVEFASSAAAFASFFSMFGVGSYGIRACAQVRDNEQVLNQACRELLLLTLCSTVLVYFVFAICIVTVPAFSEQQLVLWIFSVSIVLNTLSVSWYINALEMYGYIAIRTLIVKIASLVAIVFLVNTPDDYYVYALILVLATGGANLCNFILLCRKQALFKGSAIDLKRHIAPALAFLILDIATSLYVQASTILLGILSTSAAVAFYAVSIKMKNAMVSVSTALTAVVLPRAAHLIANDEEAFMHLTSKAMESVVASSFPLAIIIFFGADHVISLLAGSEYVDAVVLVRILSPVSILIAMSNVLNSDICIPLGKESDLKWIFIVAGIINVMLCFVALPSFGAIGACIATAVSESVVFILLLKLVGSRIRQNIFGSFSRIMFASLLPAAIFPIVMVVLENTLVSFLLLVLLYLTLYLVLLKRMNVQIVDDVLRKLRIRAKE